MVTNIPNLKNYKVKSNGRVDFFFDRLLNIYPRGHQKLLNLSKYQRLRKGKSF